MRHIIAWALSILHTYNHVIYSLQDVVPIPKTCIPFQTVLLSCHYLNA